MNSKRSFLFCTITIILIGLFISLQACLNDVFTDLFPLFLFYVMVLAVTESLSINLGNDTSISLGFVIGIASVILFEPLVAATVLFIGTILRMEYENNHFSHLRNTDFFKRLFNACAYAIIAFSSGMVYQSDYPKQFFLGHFMGYSIVHILLAIVTYTSLCIGVYAVLLAFQNKCSVLQIAKEHGWVFASFFGLAPFGFAIAIAQDHYGWFSLFLIFGPLLLARYSFIQYLQMKQHYILTINSFTRALDAKDQYTNGHSERVSVYATTLAKRLKLPDKMIQELKVAALLHDVGKIGISDTILNKPEKLSLQEMFEIKRHPEIGARIIEEIHFLKHTAKVIRHHHERYDGSGYPDAISNLEIPYESQIISVVDAYDAMTSNRPYRSAMTKVQALKIIEMESGRQFNPQIAEAFILMMQEMDEDDVC